MMTVAGAPDERAGQHRPHRTPHERAGECSITFQLLVRPWCAVSPHDRLDWLCQHLPMRVEVGLHGSCIRVHSGTGRGREASVTMSEVS